MMTLTSAFRDSSQVTKLIKLIQTVADPLADKWGRPLQVMEVCGGHTHAIFKFGLDQLFPKSVEFIHGPGCPVCVLPVETIDQALAIAEQPEVIFTSFGDPLRVLGSKKSLLQAKAQGADIRVLYSPLDAIDLAKNNPDKQVVFFAIGFDTTIPSIAFSLLTAAQQGIRNLRFLCHHIRLMPTLMALLVGDDVQLDGFVGPGHVSMVIGANAYHPIAECFQKPLVIAGFEPVDFLQALYQLILQLAQSRCEIENAYARVVTAEGNLSAQQTISTVFDDGVDSQWRGLGVVPGSGVKIKDYYQAFDATQLLSSTVLSLSSAEITDPGYCNAVLTGKLKPDQCPLFRKHCTPENPKGALMVSGEGACAAYYHYKREFCV
ncbi:hydrogenase formation protein HypD [Spartinivicinus ruber]|uniref:hydrogenase formation protein HypD n=1 Tax=Spartinivicinus ruber TaxID=2683272 RepID=UPI001E4F2884|nr:hydrogenase formation protein HypD [Spartinivicinus ruber]